MDSITRQELAININNIPDVFSVVINKDEFNLQNDMKFFQLALNEDIANDEEDILVYMANFNIENQAVVPFKGSNFNEFGVFTKDLYDVFPTIYRKLKDDLLIIE